MINITDKKSMDNFKCYVVNGSSSMTWILQHDILYCILYVFSQVVEQVMSAKNASSAYKTDLPVATLKVSTIRACDIKV